MGGGCRVTVAGKARFACVEGPGFGVHQVDFEELRGGELHPGGVSHGQTNNLSPLISWPIPVKRS